LFDFLIPVLVTGVEWRTVSRHKLKMNLNRP
jgi:hypothetical protein